MNHVTTYTCGAGHASFVAHAACPTCGATLATQCEPARATLVAETLVRISPIGRPFRLGLAATESGARTLCIIDEGVSGATVELFVEGDRYRARRFRG